MVISFCIPSHQNFTSFIWEWPKGAHLKTNMRFKSREVSLVVEGWDPAWNRLPRTTLRVFSFHSFLSSIVVIIIIIITVTKMMMEIIFIVITIVTVTISLIIVLSLSVSLLYYYEHVSQLHHVLCVIASGRFTINHYGVRFSGASLFYLWFDIFHDSFIWTIRAY